MKLDMLPDFTLHYVANMGIGDAELLGNRLVSDSAGSMQSTDGANHFVSQLCIGVRLTTPDGLLGPCCMPSSPSADSFRMALQGVTVSGERPSLSHHITGVVDSRSAPEVIWAATGAVVTAMKHEGISRDLAVGEDVGHSRSMDALPVNPELAIAVDVKASRPGPALAGLINLLPEAFSQSARRCHVAANSTSIVAAEEATGASSIVIRDQELSTTAGARNRNGRLRHISPQSSNIEHCHSNTGVRV
jgi:hypothetical protein